jgi:hypothetical protein
MNTITVDIPASHWLTIEVPREVPAGRTILAFTPAPAVMEQAETVPHLEIEGADKERAAPPRMTAREAIEKCRGIAKGSRFTSERLFEYRREDVKAEEAQYRRDFRKDGTVD